MAKARFPAICGRITDSMVKNQLPVLAIPHLVSIRDTGMIVANTGNIMAASTMDCKNRFSLN